ncbi:MAG: hypothetical protein PVG27_08980 [Chloroflexota bacterium]
MGVIRFARAHLDALVALVLTAAYLGEVYLARTDVAGEPFVAGLEVEETVAVAAGAAFLLSLALRTRMPGVPLALALVAFTLLGRGAFEATTTLVLGAALCAYSVGAWSGGRAAVIGALGVGALVGLLVLRSSSATLEPREIAGPVFVLSGAWVLGLLIRSSRISRRDPRVSAGFEWTTSGDRVPDSAGRDDTVRELREVIERAMSTVILHARDARRSMQGDPRKADHSLAVIEAAGTDALEETQRLTGLLLSPNGTPLPEPQPGLADLEFLAEEMTRAGLPVDTHVTGRPLPLTPDLDGVAFRVVQEALLSTLNGATDATASVHVRYEPDALEIEVTDDGLAAGGDGAEETAGLMAVRKEVASLGGTLDAGPREGRGYWVLAQLPYEPVWS